MGIGIGHNKDGSTMTMTINWRVKCVTKRHSVENCHSMLAIALFGYSEGLWAV